MIQEQNEHQLDFEEKKAVKLFIMLYYIFFIGFEIFWTAVMPIITHKKMTPFANDGLGYWYYILIFLLPPVTFLLLKKRSPYKVKYFLLIGYIVIDFIDNLLRYYGTTKVFADGGVVEALFVFYSPVFINKRFYWTVVSGILGKYALLGVVLLNRGVIIPIIVYLVLAGCAYVLVNRLTSYIQSLTAVQRELHQKEKLAAIGQMATAIGHEIRNPLSTLKGFTQLQKETYPNTNDHYSIMIQEIDRINTIVNDLLFIGKPKSIHLQYEQIPPLIDYILSITEKMAEEKGIKINKQIEDTLPEIECDEKQIKQLLLNLIKNAIESMDEGEIEVSVSRYEANHVCISIKDEGSGISESDLEKIGKAFYTTKPDGTGLGLLISNQIVHDHKGKLNIKSNLTKGTIFEVILPITQK